MSADITGSNRVIAGLARFAVCGLVGVTGTVNTTFGQQCNLQEISKLVAADASGGEEFGVSVAVSGDTAIVGAYLDSHAGGGSAGSSYIFVRSGGTWLQQAKLTASDASFDDHFGYSVAVSGDTAVVGVPNDNGINPSLSDDGSAYIFVRSSGVWTQRAKLTTSDGASDDQFGVSVSVSGDTVVIGAFGDDHINGSLASEGSAYVFVKPPGGWVNMNETCKLTASDAMAGASFGASVSVASETVVVGAFTAGHPGVSHAGSAYVFVKPTGGWNNQTETAKLTASDEASNDGFGIAVAVSGKTVIVGSPLDDNASGGDAGSAYVFAAGPCGWTNSTEVAKLTASDAIAGDNFGCSVAVSNGTAVIGAVSASNAEIIGGGAAYVFTRIGGAWSEQARLTATDSAQRDFFGYSVAVAHKTAFVGASADTNSGGTLAGSAYIFRAEICDSDADGVANVEDVCPNSPVGPAVDSTGRPLRDCNQDCAFNALDIQCIVDELLSQ